MSLATLGVVIISRMMMMMTMMRTTHQAMAFTVFSSPSPTQMMLVWNKKICHHPSQSYRTRIVIPRNCFSHDYDDIFGRKLPPRYLSSSSPLSGSQMISSTSSLGLYGRRHRGEYSSALSRASRKEDDREIDRVGVRRSSGCRERSSKTRQTIWHDRRSSSLVALAASMAPISQSNLAVSIDRPLLSFDNYYRSPTATSSSSSFWPSVLAVLLSDICKTAVIAFLLAAGISLLAKFLKGGGGGGGGSTTRNVEGPSVFSQVKDQLLSLASSLLPSSPSSSSSSSSKSKRGQTKNIASPPFDGDGGWGKCTLRSKKKRLGSSSYSLYEFDLPKKEYVLPLALGQQLDFCCLSSDDEIVMGSFYPYEMGGDDEDGDSRGIVRLVLPDDDGGSSGGGGEGSGSKASVGLGSSKFIQVLQNELRPGDEVAIKPGKTTLHYKGEHVPVTDMIYIASGLGIVPIVDQVKAIVPKGSSSVKVTSVIWINDNRHDFDIAMDELEKEYRKHSTKLAVSCILDDVIKNPMEGNREIEEAVPYFDRGSMAVIAGPKRFSEKVKVYLMRKGYPENCICVLP